MKKLYLLALLLFFPAQVWATTYTVTSCTQANVQAAVNSAIAGDSVYLNCASSTWSSYVNISKGITIYGNGPTSTTITANSSALFNITLANTDNFRMHNMGFTGTGGYIGLETTLIRLHGTKGGTIWNSLRMDHLKFTNVPYHSVTMDIWDEIPYHPKALFDNITYTNSGGGRFIKIAGNNSTWRETDQYGTDYAIFIEDSTFYWSAAAVNSDVSDTEHGVRLVVRYNTITNGDIQTHDTGGTQGARGNRIAEFYNNTLSCVAGGCSSMTGIGLRGGGYIVYNNSITGNFWAGAYAQVWRSNPGYAGFLGSECNGTAVRACNTPTYYHCSGGDHAACSYPGDSTCAGKGSCVVACTSNSDCPTGTDGTATCLATVDNVDGSSGGTGYPCRDQTGWGQEYGTGGRYQYPSPVYWYNNTGLSPSMNQGAYLAENRDYCYHSPTTTCGSKAGWTYTSYSYPHPWREEVPFPGTPPVISNLTVTGAVNGVLACTSDPRDTEITLTTDKTATCKGSPTDEAYADMDWTFDDTNSTSHVKTLGRPCDTSNTYYIRCTAGGYPNLSSSVINYVVSPAGGDTGAPTFVSAALNTDGRTLIITFNETVTSGSGGLDGWTITPSGGAATIAYSTGIYSTTMAYITSRVIYPGETLTIAYTQPGDGVEDSSGNDFANLSAQSVTNNSTQNPVIGTSRTIWADDVDKGAGFDEWGSGTSGIELGVKFRSSVAAVISGIRFWKTTNDTGTHIGNIWTTSGTNLGTVTFSGESATGLQTATFSSPIHIAADTTYISSAFHPAGYFGVTNQYFGSVGVTNNPLSAPQSAAGDYNGVFRSELSASAFPSAGSTYHQNFWVEPILEQRTSMTIELGVGPVTITIGGGTATLTW